MHPRQNAYRRSDSKVCLGHQIAADAVADQQTEDDHIKETHEQARRVDVAANGPIIRVDGSGVGDESCRSSGWTDDEGATKTVKKDMNDVGGKKCLEEQALGTP